MANTAKNPTTAANLATEAQAPESKVFVAGYNTITFDDGKTGIALLMKDVVSKNPIFKTKANKSGTAWIVNGITMEELKKEMPLGSLVVGATWGAEKPSQFGGIYEVEGLV